jgi:hypothetical protein
MFRIFLSLPLPARHSGSTRDRAALSKKSRRWLRILRCALVLLWRCLDIC